VINNSIVTNRSSGGGGGSSTASVEGRVLATLLTEMDGVSQRGSEGVVVIGATNRLDFIDAALLRKVSYSLVAIVFSLSSLLSHYEQGRFHHILHIPPPNEEERLQLVRYFLRKCSSSAADGGVEMEEHVIRVSTALKPQSSGAEIEHACKQYLLTELMHLC
jgi:SpoVK/Ycf46/Vps4 family AAA+-type ATPase